MADRNSSGWKIIGIILIIGLLVLPEGASAGKRLKCPKGEVDVGCSCVNLEQSKAEMKKSQKVDQQFAQVAIATYHETMKAYARAWETYSAYMRVSAGCKNNWKKFYKAYQEWNVVLINSRRYIRRCDGLRAGLLRTIRYKKRFLSRIKFQTSWLKQNRKYVKKLSEKIDRVKDYINDSCRFIQRLLVHQKTVAWSHTLEAKKKLIRLRIMLKPLLKTLALQKKQYKDQCDKITLKRQWKKYRTSRYHALMTKRGAQRMKRCTKRAMRYAQIQVQSKMMLLRERANQSKVVYLRFVHKMALDKFNLCVTNYGLGKCKKSKLLYVDEDDSRKLFKKLTHAMRNEYRDKQQYYAKTLNRKWRELRRKEGF